MTKAWNIEPIGKRKGMVMTAQNIRPNVELAHQFADAMQRAGISPAEGCFTLAITYAVWLDACDEACPEHCDAMLDLAKRTARDTFTRLRRLRTIKQQLTDEALES